MRDKLISVVLILGILLLLGVSCSDAVRNPVAQFLVSVTSGSSPLDVAFDASASYAPGATIVDYSWTFGDGAQGHGAICQHTYVASADAEYPLTWTVTLVVTDSHGKTGSATNTMVITGAAPVARFSATPRSGYSPLTVVFDAAASKDGERSIVSYAWDYGDGVQGSGVSSVHTYVSPTHGTYAVTLTVADSAGRKGITTDSISIWGPPPSPGSGGGGTGTDSTTITASAGANGTISPNGSVRVSYGADQAFTMAPDAHCHVADVVVDGSSVGAVTTYTFHHIVASHTIHATYAVDTHTLTYTSGAGGSIEGPSPQTVEYGGTGSAVTAVADACSHLVRWNDGSTDNPRTDTNVTADHTFSAEFAASGPYALEYIAGDGGSIRGTSLQTVDCGEDGTQVTAVPDSCSSFVNWSDGTTANPRTDGNVTADVTVTANFTADGPYTLIYTASDGGTISGDTPQTVPCGDDGSEVSADADPCHHFVNWSDGRTDNPRTDTNVTADVTARAIFSIDHYTLDYAADAGGTIHGETHQTVDCGASGTEVRAVADACHDFTEWSDGSTHNPRTDTSVTENVSVTATFDAKGSYTLEYIAGDGGSIRGTTLQTVDCGEDGTQVTAVPDSCSSFVNWSDGTTANPRTDGNVTADVTVTANFAADGPYTLTYTASDGGTISGDTPQTVPCGDDGSEVSADADPCHHFVKWSDGRTDNPRTDTNVTADVTARAIFAIDHYTLDYAADAGGTIHGETHQTVDCGASGTEVRAVADACHDFTEWSDGSTHNPRTDTSVTENVSVTATFDAKGSYTLEYIAGDGGSIRGTRLQTVDCGEDGTQVTAVPDSCSSFVNWSDGTTANPRTDGNVTADVTVTANFTADGPYTLTYTASDGGTISGDASQTVACGDDGSEVSADADPCHHFVKWSDGRTDNPRTDTNVTADVTARAIFAIDTYTLDYAADAGGTIHGETHQTVDCGASGTEVRAVADACHDFTEWSDGSTHNPRTDISVTENVSVTATFDAKGSYTLEYIAGDGGSIRGTSLQTVDCGEDGTQVTAVPDEDYEFVDWSDGSTDNPRRDLDVMADITVTAHFRSTI